MIRPILAAAVALISVPAVAQLAPSLPQMVTPRVIEPTAPAGKTPALAAVQQRIASLQSQLRITTDQAGPWRAFAEVMIETAQSTDAQASQRAARMRSMDAVSNMEAYARITRAYADSSERLAAAFRTLYGVLTPPQRQAADALFSQQPAAPGR